MAGPSGAIQRLQPWTRRVRPTNTDPSAFYDEELRRLEASSKALTDAVKDVDARLRSIGK